MKYNVIKKIFTFNLVIFFCVSMNLCLAISPWQAFDGIKLIGYAYKSKCIEELTLEIDHSMENLEISFYNSPPEYSLRWYLRAWNLLCASLNKYDERISKENNVMSLKIQALYKKITTPL